MFVNTLGLRRREERFRKETVSGYLFNADLSLPVFKGSLYTNLIVVLSGKLPRLPPPLSWILQCLHLYKHSRTRISKSLMHS